MKPGEFATIRVTMLVMELGRRRPSSCTTHFDLESAITAARRLSRSRYRGRYAVWIEHVDAPATLARLPIQTSLIQGVSPRCAGRERG